MYRALAYEEPGFTCVAEFSVLSGRIVQGKYYRNPSHETAMAASCPVTDSGFPDVLLCQRRWLSFFYDELLSGLCRRDWHLCVASIACASHAVEYSGNVQRQRNEKDCLRIMSVAGIFEEIGKFQFILYDNRAHMRFIRKVDLCVCAVCELVSIQGKDAVANLGDVLTVTSRVPSPPCRC